MPQLGKILIVVGLLIAAVGVFLSLGGKIGWIGRLPGDILIKGKRGVFYFPLATSIIASVVLSFVLYLIKRK
ncbi:MAG: DUF2905 domain-containing protein [Deltaproteobacteria bacterium]|nr:DUF2905 domain-containing protein [Deltaproteobacteria bacterium]